MGEYKDPPKTVPCSMIVAAGVGILASIVMILVAVFT